MPDLKQIVLNMLVSADGGIPLFMQTLSGNCSDKTVFRETVTTFRQGLRANLQEITYWVADSYFYTTKTIQEVVTDIKWISRVPDNIKEAKDIIKKLTQEMITLSPNSSDTIKDTEISPLSKGYSYIKHMSEYGNVSQRWLVIHSEHAETRTRKSVERHVKMEFDKMYRYRKKLQQQTFQSETEIEEARLKFQEKMKYHFCQVKQLQLINKYSRRGRPRKVIHQNDVQQFYKAEYELVQNKQAIDLAVLKKAIFIVATNEHDHHLLTDVELFMNYKGQNHVEKGFRFLKDPLFFASSLFLKKPERIIALTMVMCLSLLVYSIGERKLRKLLQEQKETIQNQLKKPTNSPTLKWVFQLFEDVHLVKIDELTKKSRYEVKNLRPDGIKVLKILGKNYMEPYLLS